MQKYKEIFGSEQIHQEMLQAVKTIYEAVSVTLGPKGRNVLIEKEGNVPHITKDGLSVMNAIQLASSVQNVVAQIFKSVVDHMPGDGTTSATVLTSYMYKYGMKVILAGASPIAIKNGIDKAVSHVIKTLDLISSPIETRQDLVHIASISTNNDIPLGMMIADCFQAIGKNGKINVIEGQSLYMQEPEIISGYNFDAGMMSSYFITDAKDKTSKLSNPFVLLCDHRINSAKDLLPALEIATNEKRALLIIADDVAEEVLTVLIINNINGSVPICTVKAPYFGEKKSGLLRDIAVYTGATCISKDLNMSLKEITREDLGIAQSALIEMKHTSIVADSNRNTHINEHIADLHQQMEKAKTAYDKEVVEERIAHLQGAVAIITVGAETEIAMKEKKDRIDDAQNATKEALINGYLPGGGASLVMASDKLSEIYDSTEINDEKLGIEIVQKALFEPLKCISHNAGVSGEVVLNTILSKKDDKFFGYDALNDRYGNMVEFGIIDPTSVVKNAVLQAATSTKLLLMTKAVISKTVEEDKHTHESNMQSMHNMGMM